MADPIWALGLMSGTSLDGIDAAALLTDGESIFGFGPKRFIPYTSEQAGLLRSGLGKRQADVSAILEDLVCETHVLAAQYFPTTELVGFHGQTLSHAPEEFHTFQLGDGAALANECGKKVVWDFRTADVLSGGEGAPLVPVFHFACAQTMGIAEITAIVNIGGVANVTWLDPQRANAESDGALLAFDTGPGNALINDFLMQRLNLPMDEGGDVAGTGKVDKNIVNAVLENDYFSRKPPKSLDRDAFANVLAQVSHLSTEDGCATLTEITAASIAAALHHMPHPPEKWLITGGGRHNRTLMQMIGTRTNKLVEPVESVGLDGDMLEAQAFAYLAVRVLRGLPTSLPSTTGARLPVCGGQVSVPKQEQTLKFV